jgi:hypothetical protein
MEGCQVGGAVEIELPHGAFGLVLSVSRESASANTADGRTGKKQDRLHLSGVHPIMTEDLKEFLPKVESALTKCAIRCCRQIRQRP